MALGAGETIAQTSSITVTLTPSDYNGFNISCFGLKDGAIDATVSGGTPPYAYSWSNNATTEDLPSVAAGYYRLVVTDAASATGEAEITLTQPLALRMSINPFAYPSGYNVSCHDCFNGSIDITVADGVAPYSYDWGDEVYTQDRSGLGALAYQLTATDANGCVITSGRISLTQPERSDWRMDGNANTNPAQHFFGSTDNQDVVFKSNGQERLRLLADGGTRLSGLGGGGILKGGGDGLIQVLPDVELEAMVQGIVTNPNLWDLEPFWKTNGNTLENQLGAEAFIGSVDNHPLRFRTNNALRMNLTTSGDLGIMERLGVGYDGIENTLGNYPSRVNIKAYEGRWLRLTDSGGNHWQLGLGTGMNQTEGLCFMHTEGAFPPTQGNPSLTLFPDGGLQAGPNMLVAADGKVSIGTDATSAVGMLVNVLGGIHTDKLVLGDVTAPTGYRLFVKNGILSEKVVVTLHNGGQWSDDVFKPGYKLMPLDDVADFIAANGHLPGVPSADCMVEAGLDVVRTDATLLRKIEELTLHLIAVEKRMAEIELENNALKQSIGRP